MDKINKFLIKLNKKEKAVFLKIFADIRSLNLSNYDIKALQGITDVFRLRKGDIRIIFVKNKNKGIILDIAYRKDIYKNL